MKSIAIIGSSGMLGQSVVKQFKSKYNIQQLNSTNCDITTKSCINDPHLNEANIIINCAAYTNVDKAELYKQEACKVNGIGVQNLTTITKKTNALLIHISSDFVFSGQQNVPYQIDDTPNPISVYGKSKRFGEAIIQNSNSKFLIIRTSWLFGLNSNNFVETIINKGKELGKLNVVNDQFGRPTFCDDLSWAIEQFINNKTTGIKHFCNQGITSWFEFAQEIINKLNLNVKINPCTTKEYPTPAKRPPYSVLDLSDTDLPTRHWKLALFDYLQKR